MDAIQELNKYVETQIERGVDRQSIADTLKANGWNTAVVDQAIAQHDINQEQSKNEEVEHSPTDNKSPKRFLFVKTWSEYVVQGNDIISILFQIGFASIFLVNGIIALGKPSDFQGLLQAFPLAVQIDHIDWMITFAGINDITLGCLILLGKARKIVWVWAGLWLAMVSVIKLIYLF